MTIMDDLKRRDFTVNSIAINVKTKEVLDPFKGRKDIQSKLLRATDKTAFVEDPLRIVRGIQFAARFKFEI
jgi:tRNA nucleotidyltransferase/poly(A) polymerase